MDKKVLYKCDPEKNTECKKNFCFIRGGGCRYTADPNAAKLDKRGNKIEIPNFEEYDANDEPTTNEFKPHDEIEQAWREGYLQGLTSAAQKRMYSASTAQKITIVGKMPSLNEYVEACRRNAHCGARLKCNVETGIIPQLAKLKKIEKPVHITFIWHEINKRRDKDNVAAAKKFILDAMQKSGKLINDNNNYITGFTDKFDYTAKENAVTLIIESGEKE